MAFCTQCGNKAADGDAFCTRCGTPIEQPSAPLDSPTQAIPQASSPAPQSATTVALPQQAARATYDQQTAAMPPANSSAPQAPFAGSAAQQRTPLPENQHPAGQPPYGYAPPNAPMPAFAGGPAPTQAGGLNQRTVIIACAVIAAIAVIAIIVVLLIAPGGSKAYSVTFQTNGGVDIPATAAEPGTTISAPANPTKAGYVFEGWYTDPNCTQQATFPYKVEKDTVLYAKWTEKGNATQTGNGNSPSTPTNTQNNSVGATGTNQTSSNTVSISVTGADGTVRTAEIHRQGSTQRVLPEGSTRRLTANDVKGLSDAERCIAWNEIIAASNGYVFKNSGLANYFSKCSWYHPDPSASGAGSMNADQSANVELLKSYTDSWWLNLATY